MTKTVVALYDDFSAAREVVSELVDNGFARDDISLMAPNVVEPGSIESASTDSAANIARDDTTTEELSVSGVAEGAGVGAGLGAALGGLGGLLVGMGALTVPGIGPVLAAGPISAAISGLAGAGVGAVAGGVAGRLLGALMDMGIPEERAHYYAEGIRRGGTLLVIRTDDDRARDVVHILNRHRPVDLNERSERWRQGGWSRFDPIGPSYQTGMVDSSPLGMAGNAGLAGGDALAGTAGMTSTGLPGSPEAASNAERSLGSSPGDSSSSAG